MERMNSPQSVAVAAVGVVGQETKIFKYTIKISVILLVIVGILSLILN